MEPLVAEAGLARYGGYDLKRGIPMTSPSMAERSAEVPSLGLVPARSRSSHSCRGICVSSGSSWWASRAVLSVWRQNVPSARLRSMRGWPAAP
jgi:hypothetical protein